MRIHDEDAHRSGEGRVGEKEQEQRREAAHVAIPTRAGGEGKRGPYRWSGRPGTERVQRGEWMKALIVLLWLVLGAGAAGAQCCGDCSGDGNVTINDLITAVNNALNGCPAAEPCCGDCSGDGEVTINDLITAVNN